MPKHSTQQRQVLTAVIAVLALAATPLPAASAAGPESTALGSPPGASAGPAAIVPIDVDADYPPGTCVLDLSGLADFTLVTSLTGCGQTITVSPTAEKRSVPKSWLTWGSSPYTESAYPNVLSTAGATSLKLKFSSAVKVAGLEAEPNSGEVHAMTAVFKKGGTTVGTITRAINGAAGARILGAKAKKINSMIISSDVDFAVAKIRVGPTSGELSPFDLPTDEYLEDMCLADLSELDLGSEVTEVDMPGEVCMIHKVSFTSPAGPDGVSDVLPLQILQVPSTWPSWGSPPFTQISNPRVLSTQGQTSVVMTFGGEDVYGGTNCKGGVEVQPEGLDDHLFKGEFRDYFGNVLGTVYTTANGNAGARLLGAATTGDPLIKSITVTDISTAVGPTGFALAQLHDCAQSGQGGIRNISDHKRFNKFRQKSCRAVFEESDELSVITGVDLTEPAGQCDQHDASFWAIAGTPLAMKVLEVPGTWPNWGGGQFTESPTPFVLSTEGPTSVLITYGAPGVNAGSRDAVSAEVQPAGGGGHLYLAEFRDYQGTLIGVQLHNASSPSGARRIAGESALAGVKIKTLRITDISSAVTPSGFALAQLRSSFL